MTRKSQRRIPRLVSRLGLLTISGLACMAGCELGFRVLGSVLHAVVRYESDKELGWKFLPGIDVLLRNSAGECYSFRTNRDGWALHDLDEGLFLHPDRSRVLILGDSFAEGVGVGVDRRFDAVATRTTSTVEFRAVGCGGYSTEQQLLLLRQLLRELRAGDEVVLLTCSNDIPDLAYSSHSGRQKPTARLDGETVTVEPPDLGLRDWLRSHSWLASFLIGRLLPGERAQVLKAEDCGRAYVGLVRAMARELPPGVGFHVVFHTWNDPVLRDEQVFHQLRESGISSTDLDAILRDKASSPDNFLPCGHWTETGNLVAANWFVENFK